MTAITKTAKVENYTSEDTLKLVNLYNAGKGVDVPALAEMFSRTARSIIAKLSREKVYISKAGYKTKTGEAVISKDDLADKLAELVGFTEAEAESLTKANKTALAKLVKMAIAFKGEESES